MSVLFTIKANADANADTSKRKIIDMGIIRSSTMNESMPLLALSTADKKCCSFPKYVGISM